MLCLLVPSDLRPSTAHPTPAGRQSRRLRFEHTQGNAEEPVKWASLAGPDTAVTRPSAVDLAGTVGRRVRPPAARPHRVEDRLELPALGLENRRDRFPLHHDVVQGGVEQVVVVAAPVLESHRGQGGERPWALRLLLY